MAYQQVKDILQSIRQYHRQLRQKIEQAWEDSEDVRSKRLLRSIRRSEQETDLALAKYQGDGDPAVLATWIQYVPVEELEGVLSYTVFPPDADPDEVLVRKQAFDAQLAEFYRQIANQVSAPRVVDLFNSLAGMIEQRLADQSWQARECELAPEQEE